MMTLLVALKESSWSWLAFIPFLMVIKGSSGEGDRVQFRTTRIMEAGLIAVMTAVITASATSFVLMKALDVELDFIRLSINRVEKKVDHIERKTDKVIWERGEK